MKFLSFKTIAWSFAACAIAGANAAAWSAPRGDVVSTLKAFKVSQKNGAEELEAGETIRPGETLEYRVLYRNTGTRTVKDLRAVLPIPSQLRFVSGSARPANMQASTDGRTFASYPLRRRVTTPQGVKIVAVPLSEYRYIRWTIGTLASGASASVAARATLPQ